MLFFSDIISCENNIFKKVKTLKYMSRHLNLSSLSKLFYIAIVLKFEISIFKEFFIVISLITKYIYYKILDLKLYTSILWLKLLVELIRKIMSKYNQNV